MRKFINKFMSNMNLNEWILNQKEKWKSWYITTTSYFETEHLSDSEYRKRCKKSEELYKHNMNILLEIEYILKSYKEQ